MFFNLLNGLPLRMGGRGSRRAGALPRWPHISPSRIRHCEERRTARRGNLILPLVIAFGLLTLTAHAGALYRPGQQQRTVTASSYQVAVQKNGRVDISLLNGDPVFLNAYPAVLFEGDKKWTELDISSRYTFRERVNDVLGQGQALMMAKGNCEWAIRTYSTQPFFTVEAVFINDSNKPVRIAGASPWQTGGSRKPGGLRLGADAAQTRALVLDEQPPGFVRTRIDPDLPFESSWQIALHDEASGRSLIAAYLTLGDDTPSFSVSPHEDEDAGGVMVFDAATVFASPIEVPPGGRLAMPRTYFAVSETDPLLGLRRLGQALARFNNVATESTDTALTSAAILRGERGSIARLTPIPPATWDAAVETLGNTARLFYLSPYFWKTNIAQSNVPGTTESQRLAWWTGLALSANAIETAESGVVARLSPPLERPAQPIDVFRSPQPRIWSLPMDDSGEHLLVGLFNWDTSDTPIELDFAELGLARDTYYTVYDVWPRRYMGTTANGLRVAVEPESVRVLSLRRSVDWPAVLATGDRITTVSNAGDESDWESTTNTLSGTAHLNEQAQTRIDVLVPERFDAIARMSQNVRAEWPENSRVVTLRVSGTAQSATPWRVAFE